jgi:hypothetical protein
LCVHTDDADAHCARAKAAGATILQELKDADLRRACQRQDTPAG